MTISRSAALTAALAASALAISACSPPHQQDSEEKVDTATSFSAAAAQSTPAASSTAAEPAAASTSASPSEANANATQFIDCTRTPTVEPSQVQLNCFGENQITALDWEWETDSATGQGIQINPDGSTEEATLELSDPVSMDGAKVFSRVSVNGKQLAAS